MDQEKAYEGIDEQPRKEVDEPPGTDWRCVRCKEPKSKHKKALGRLTAVLEEDAWVYICPKSTFMSYNEQQERAGL